MEVKNYFAFTKENKAIPFCTAYLYYAGTNDLATGVKDKNGNPIDNPFTADANGLAQFTGPNGVYDLRFKSGVRDYRIRTSIVDTEALLEAAGQAADSAIDAGGEADRASTEADRSEIAADASAISGNQFQTISDGLANTSGTGATNRYFSVPSAEDAEYLIRYLNDSNTAVEVKRFPSSKPFALGFNSRGGYSYCVVDAFGKILIGVTNDGDLFSPKLGSIFENFYDKREVFTSTGDRSGYVYSVLDSQGKLLLAVDKNGGLFTPQTGRIAENFLDGRVLNITAPDSGRSGYIASLLDLAGKILLGVTSYGDIKFSSGLTLSSADRRSGYTFSFLDSTGKILLGLSNSGGLRVAGSALDDIIDKRLAGNSLATKYITPSRDLVFIGDSLTQGAGGQTTWRQQLPALLSGDARVSTNYAIGGQSSFQICARVGAIYSKLTVAGNEIPASGGVAVTARTISLLTSQGTQSVTGWLYGIAGTLSRDGSDNYTFTRTTAGSATYCPASVPFIPDVLYGESPFGTTFIFIGRNNLSQVAEIKDHIQRTVAWLRTQDKHFVVIPATNGTGEGIGTTNYGYLTDVEDWAENLYGEQCINVRKLSLNFGDGSAGDNEDIAAGIIPRSLRIDSVHFTTALHTQIAIKVAELLNRRNW